MTRRPACFAKFGGTKALRGVFAISGLPAGHLLRAHGCYEWIELRATSSYGNKPWPCVPKLRGDDRARQSPSSRVPPQGGKDFSLAPNLVAERPVPRQGTAQLVAVCHAGHELHRVERDGRRVPVRRVPRRPGTIEPGGGVPGDGLAVARQRGARDASSIWEHDTVRKRISVLVHDERLHRPVGLHVLVARRARRLRHVSRCARTRRRPGRTRRSPSTRAHAPGNRTGSISSTTCRCAPCRRVRRPRRRASIPTAPAAAGRRGWPDLAASTATSRRAVAPVEPRSARSAARSTGGVFEFIKLAGTPAGVVLQATGAGDDGRIRSADGELPAREQQRRAQARDRASCTTTTSRTCRPARSGWRRASRCPPTRIGRSRRRRWTNATLSVYPATIGPDQWIRLDNVTLKRTPSAAIAAPSASNRQQPGRWRRCVDVARGAGRRRRRRAHRRRNRRRSWAWIPDVG